MRKLNAVKMQLLALLVLGLSNPAHSSVRQAGRITYPHVMPNGVVLFLHGGVVVGTPPGCAAGNPGRWAFDASTPAGQAKLSVLLTAYSQGKSITVHGTGNCDGAWADTETLSWFHIAE